MSKRTTLIAALSATLIVGASAGFAWACTVQARVLTLAPPMGIRGSSVLVNGEAIAPEGPVEIRWNSPTGLTVGTGKADIARTFSIGVTIPDVEPGIYYLIASVGDSALARTAFQVLPASTDTGEGPAAGHAATTVSPDLWTGFSESENNPGLLTPSDTSVPSRSPVGLAMGAGLLAFGLAAFGTTLTVGVLRKRRTGRAHS